MSRSRPFINPDTNEITWFDIRAPAKAKHLELLADFEEIEVDDLLDAELSQRQVLYRLHKLENKIPQEVLEKRRKKLEAGPVVCRICPTYGWECEGRITKHHFVPRWLLLELDHYQRYASRAKSTIPICISRHRDLHFRSENQTPKSIVNFLENPEKELAEQALRELRDTRPAIFSLISDGNFRSYEYQLVRDFTEGKFRT